MQAKRKSKDYIPVTVPFSAESPSAKASRAGEPEKKSAIEISSWANRSVWTDRMLNALSVGVRGGKWHALIDKVYRELNLFVSARKVVGKKGAAGVDRQSTEDFSEQEIAEIKQLYEQLRTDTYRPQAVRRVQIPKPGSKQTRPLGIPTVRDRVVQTALVNVIEPIFDNEFHERSFGFRHGRSCHDALRVVEELLETGHVFVVDADLQGYFDTIPKDRLLALVSGKISDRRVLDLVKQFLDQSVLEELREWTPESGVPQGAVLSPLLSNLYLNELDHRMADRGYEMVRYADDFVILCRSQEQAESALEEVKRFVREAGLTLHPEKTHIVDSRVKSFDFLGYSFRGKLRFPRAKSHQKMVDTIRRLTPRKSGQSLEATIAQINRVTVGWFSYFRHCTWNIFDKYDGMVRKRLRRQLLKRHRRNPKRLCRTHRWPNAYFSERGYRSLRLAHSAYVQSLDGTH
ncbi:group II intron reverse transcriptase/maturase [Rhodopirellula europaea]|uniref:Reverse transcriptase/maturase n=2 Tax=Rhodopirellula TaxID=265488 RepID=M2AJ93_9BACT|nr:group II intron reverse transcriptase/maturase [Rhodopirellula europaea]EMB17215.1 reverse transcriptase/maturase [Rhodopirellula europaea 6C]